MKYYQYTIDYFDDYTRLVTKFVSCCMGLPFDLKKYRSSHFIRIPGANISLYTVRSIDDPNEFLITVIETDIVHTRIVRCSEQKQKQVKGYREDLYNKILIKDKPRKTKVNLFNDINDQDYRLKRLLNMYQVSLDELFTLNDSAYQEYISNESR